METSQILEQEQVQKIANKYERLGYKVVHTPQTEERPEFLRQYHPDLIVQKGSENIVIEVKSRQSLIHNPEVRELARILEDKKDWKFELVVLGTGNSTFNQEASLDKEDIQKRIEQSQELFEHGYLEASLLSIWSATEAYLRILVQQEDIELEKNAPLYLIKNLITEGVINQKEYQLLKEAIKHRNSVAHGYKSIDLNTSIVKRLIQFTGKFI